MVAKKNKIKNVQKNFWDLKSTLRLFLVFLVFSGIILLYYKVPELLRYLKIQKYKCYAIGEIVSINDISIITQDLDGQNYKTPYYTIKYKFKTENIIYFSTDNLPNRGKYAKFINQMFNSDFENTIGVKYKCDNPNENIILLE